MSNAFHHRHASCSPRSSRSRRRHRRRRRRAVVGRRRCAPASRRRADGDSLARASALDSLVNFADVVERINPAVVNIDATARGRERDGAGAVTRTDPPGAVRRTGSRSAIRAQTRAARRRQRVHHRCRRQHPDEQPRHRSRRTDHRSSCPTAAALRAASSAPIRTPTSRSIKVDGQTGLPVAPLGDSDEAADGRVGVRDRQPARLRALGDRRRGQLPRAQAVRREPGQLHPDRRGDQFRQQRRAADQRARRGDRHQRRDQLAGEQHRLRRADQRRARRFCRSCARAGACRRGYIGVGCATWIPISSAR